MTVVFIDVVGSLGVILDKDPEDAHEVLTSALEVMAQAVHAYGGVVADRQGDGIMAIFGAPASQDDHAARACYAALRLHAEVARSLAPKIALRVGMNSGEVAVGTALNDFALDYTATGAVVHIAARLQSAATPNSTLMTSQTAALVRDVMLTEPMGHSLLKGLTEPVILHRLVGPVFNRNRSSRDIGRALLGRAGPLAALNESLEAAVDNRGCVVGISGEAGIGKTTLIEQFVQRQRVAAKIIRSTAEHHTSVAPLQPFCGVLVEILELEGVPTAQRRSVVRDGLLRLKLDPQVHEPPLFELLDIEGPPESWEGLAPLVRHELVGAAVLEVLFAESRQRPLVVAFDDMHRADLSSIELVDQLIKTIVQQRMLVIVAFRPEFTHNWERNESYRQIRLDRLNDEDTRALIARLLGKAVPPRVERQLISWSRGNPLFLRESVRAMVDAGAIINPEVAAELVVPPSIGAVISARIDRLPPTAKRTLLAASVLGEQFTADTLGKVCDVTKGTVAMQLDALMAAEFVRPMEDASRTYVFEHGLFQEIGYATLLRRQRRDLHRAAFKALRLGAQDLTPPHIEELAHHAFAGELWVDAVPLCREAGRRAAARYSNRQAALHFENAVIALARTVPEGQPSLDAIELRLELRSVCIPLLRLERIGTLLAEANAMAELLGNLSLRAKIAGYLAGHAYLTRSAALSIESCKGALRVAERSTEASLRVAPRLYLAQAYYGVGKYRRVVATLEKDSSLQDLTLSGAAVGLPLRPTLMRAYWIAIAQAELGQFALAEAIVNEMLTLADKQQPFELLYALTAMGFILLLRGELDAALVSSSSALATAEQNDITFIIPVLASQVGYLLATQSHETEGVAMARRAVVKAEEIGSNAGLSRWYARLAGACLLARNVDEARQHAETAFRIAEEGGELGYLCSALRLRAKIKATDGTFEGAANDLHRAIELARHLQLGPALAKCYFETGGLAYCTGNLKDARRAFQVAGKSFLRYGMRAWAAQVDSALACLRSGSAQPTVKPTAGSGE